MSKNYSSLYNMKDFFYNQFFPKYFEIESINDLNVGLLGTTADIEASMGEDTANMVTTLIKEMFPNKMQIPETAYTYAALFKMKDIFAKPAEMNIALLVKESDILKYMEPIGNIYKFVLDRNMSIDVEGVYYMLDYDINVQVSDFKGGHIYTSLYDYSISNDLSSSSTTPYLSNKIIKESGENYLAIYAKVHQVSKTIVNKVLIENSVISNTKFELTFEDQLANFEVFYKEPGAEDYIQLQKLLKSSPAITTPYCNYQFIDDNRIEISFSSKERYFQPKFSSDIKIELFTTTGSKGNFEVYSGSIDSISVIPKSENHTYNNSLILHAITLDESKGGVDRPDFDQLKDIICEKYSSCNTITTETDLKTSFINSKYKTGTDILFLKKRDDVQDRLFSAFSSYKDTYGEMYHTNTLDLEMISTVTENLLDVDGSLLIKPGTLFMYKNATDFNSVVIPPDNNTIGDISAYDKDEFLFCNPLLIQASTRPTNIVGYYLNSTNQTIPVNYSNVNMEVPDQFMCRNLSIKRNAIIGENAYKFTVSISPTAALSFTPLGPNGEWLDSIKLFLVMKDDNKGSAYIPFTFTTVNNQVEGFTFEANLETDDVITSQGKVRCNNIIDYITGETGTKMIPYENLICDILVFTKSTVPNPVTDAHIAGVEGFTLSNTYSTIDTKVNLILPFNAIKSTISYFNIDDVTNDQTYGMKISQLPLIDPNDLLDETRFFSIIDRLEKQYSFIKDTLNILHNNFSIDLKFVGTYGRSRMFNLSDGALLDRLNCSIKLDIYPTIGANIELLNTKVSQFIQAYIESVNNTDGSVKIFNLLKDLGNNFTEIDYVVFNGINDYDPGVQVIINNSPTDPTKPTSNLKTDAYDFIPEYVSMRMNDVKLNFITS